MIYTYIYIIDIYIYIYHIYIDIYIYIYISYIYITHILYSCYIYNNKSHENVPVRMFLTIKITHICSPMLRFFKT